MRLAGLGTAGYRWSPEIDGDDSIAKVDAAGVEATGSQASGASGAELFTIRALKPGVTRVRFAQRRPWEPADRPPVNEHTVELHVSGD